LNAHEFTLILEQAAATDKLEQIQCAAAAYAGHGGKIITFWQNNAQVEATYGTMETISHNQGLHLYYTPERKA
jgi:hypothetical protein